MFKDLKLQEYIGDYWNKEANSYNKSVMYIIRSQKASKAWKNLFTEVLGTKNLSILDVGTGPGIVALLLAELGHNVTGMDNSEEMLANARKNAVAYNLPVEFRKGDAEDLPFEDGLFDAVVNRYVLWTVTRPEKAISEWQRVLKTGGRIVIMDGNWYRSEKTLKRTIWQFISMFLILATEHRDPRVKDVNGNAKDKLWSVNAGRPDLDVEFLKKAGFRDIRIMNNIRSRTQSLLEYLKNGYEGDIFLVTGIKQ
jgi:ubiquinone/menaquinone biosynthesis C-methylase UbiE